MKKLWAFNDKYAVIKILMSIFFLSLGVILLYVYEQTNTKIIISICIFLFTLMFGYELFVKDKTLLFEEKFTTTNYFETDSMKYKTQFLKGIVVEYKDLSRVEKRLIDKKQYLYLYTKSDELIKIKLSKKFIKILYDEISAKLYKR